MKKITKYFSLMLLCMFMQACNSLDQLPVNQLTDEVFWSSLDRANMMLNMGYSQMYNRDKLWQDEALSDNLIEARGGSDATYIRKGQANSSTPLFQSEWKWCFQGIKTSNIFIDHVDFIPDAEPAVKASLVAQARFIRAYLYFRLSNFYGDIPFFLGDITMTESKAMTRTARATVLATLHQELDDIIPQLPKKEDLSAAERGRITKAAAVMLKARIYLMQGDMENVKKYCGYLIDNQDEYGRYSLFTTATASYSAYENLFVSAYEYNDEVILDYTYVPLTRTWDNFIDMVPQSVPSSRVAGRVPTQSLVESYITTNGLPVRSANTKPTPYASDPSYNENSPYANRDPRLAATVIYDGAKWKDKSATGVYTELTIDTKSGIDAYGAENATQSGYYVRKLFDPDHEVDLKMSNNIIMMRYADVLLMYAEACERTGTFTEEVWNNTIRPIRARAGFTLAEALDYPAANAANLREIIRRERRCELACEGLRYYDLIRWDGLESAGNLLSGVVYGAKLTPQSDYIKVETYSYTPGRDEWWSLPQHDMDQIPTLRPNNPNY